MTDRSDEVYHELEREIDRLRADLDNAHFYRDQYLQQLNEATELLERIARDAAGFTGDKE